MNFVLNKTVVDGL